MERLLEAFELRFWKKPDRRLRPNPKRPEAARLMSARLNCLGGFISKRLFFEKRPRWHASFRSSQSGTASEETRRYHKPYYNVRYQTSTAPEEILTSVYT